MLLATIRSLAPKQHVSFGAVPAIYIPNTVGRLPNTAMPPLSRLHKPGIARGGGKEHARAADSDGGDEEDRAAEEMELPAEWSRYRRLKVELGQFGLADDFSFEEHNSTPHLCTLDATAAGDGYVNPLLLLLYLLPWTQSFCLGSLSASQFALSDELGFLFHMMRASAGSCCQPRNFHRALKQSREASALHP